MSFLSGDRLTLGMGSRKTTPINIGASGRTVTVNGIIPSSGDGHLSIPFNGDETYFEELSIQVKEGTDIVTITKEQIDITSVDESLVPFDATYAIHSLQISKLLNHTTIDADGLNVNLDSVGQGTDDVPLKHVSINEDQISILTRKTTDSEDNDEQVTISQTGLRFLDSNADIEIAGSSVYRIFSDWVNLTLPAGFTSPVTIPAIVGPTNVPQPAITYPVPAYSTVDLGNRILVMLRGVILKAGMVPGEVCFTMPEGFRPPTALYFNNGGDGIDSLAGAGNNGLTITITGICYCTMGGSYQGFDGISYIVVKP